MNEHQRNTAFLQRCLLYDETPERHLLEERLAQAQHNDRCVRRAIGLMVVLIGLGISGLCYSAIFLEDYPRNVSRFMTQLVSKASCAVALGSFIGLLAFMVVGARYRKALDQCREDCRRLALKILESRLGQPDAVPFSALSRERSGGVGLGKF